MGADADPVPRPRPGAPRLRSAVVVRAARATRARLREAAYVWLAAQLGKQRGATHISLFDTHECGRVVRICTAYREQQGTIPCD